MATTNSYEQVPLLSVELHETNPIRFGNWIIEFTPKSLVLRNGLRIQKLGAPKGRETPKIGYFQKTWTYRRVRIVKVSMNSADKVNSEYCYTQIVGKGKVSKQVRYRLVSRIRRRGFSVCSEAVALMSCFATTGFLFRPDGSLFERQTVDVSLRINLLSLYKYVQFIFLEFTMKRMNSSSVFMILLILLIGMLSLSAMSFFNGMESNYILIQKGTAPSRHITNNHQYMQNKRGLIFALTFIVAGLSFLIMIALPSEEAQVVSKTRAAPQPVRPSRDDSAISAVFEKAVPEADFREPEAPPPPPPVLEKPGEPIPSVEAITQVELYDTDAVEEITEGEDDVVYGSGEISDAAIMHFVHKNPDSALKFLYRKQLDGKALTTTEEEIYQEWENRRMTREKVKGYIHSLMDWKDFPKQPLYEIWKMIRDHIFERLE